MVQCEADRESVRVHPVDEEALSLQVSLEERVVGGRPDEVEVDVDHVDVYSVDHGGERALSGTLGQQQGILLVLVLGQRQALPQGHPARSSHYAGLSHGSAHSLAQ